MIGKYFNAAWPVCLGIALGIGGIGVTHAASLEEVVANCESCHGKDGASSEPTVPIIGGYSAYYTEGRLIAYKNEETACPESEFVSGDKKGTKSSMCQVAKELDDGMMAEVAKHFADKPFVRAKQAFDPALAKAGEPVQVRHCDKCHEENGSLAESDAGILAGQWIPYMKQAIEEYDAGTRPMPEKMKEKYDRLDAKDKEAIIHFYASFQ
jgi:sulfide dehydrogenase cytochrome subunit